MLLELTRAPWSLTERVRALDPAARAHPIIIDEVQRVPPLLDEVHRLIEDDGILILPWAQFLERLWSGAVIT